MDVMEDTPEVFEGDVAGSAALQYSMQVVTKNYKLTNKQREAIYQAVVEAQQGIYVKLQLMGVDNTLASVYTDMLGSFGKHRINPTD